jgi:hypothetical protein
MGLVCLDSTGHLGVEVTKEEALAHLIKVYEEKYEEVMQEQEKINQVSSQILDARWWALTGEMPEGDES